MRLAGFIEHHMEEILTEWESFAKSLGAVTSSMSVEALRDHAQRMLTTIVADMRVDQSPEEQEEKGKGHDGQSRTTAAAVHGTGRHNDGFSLLQLTAEFRALRASVLRLWLPTVDQTDRTSIDEMIRFNEALDQAIAESVAMFAERAGQARDVFLAMLGHDLRSPLNAISLTTEYFERPEVETSRRLSSAKRVRRSVAVMTSMVNDLLEFSRLQLGGAIPITRESGDLVEIGQRAVDDAIAAHPSCNFEFRAPPEMSGRYDGGRLAQVLGNLLNNAAQYRTRGTTVTLSAFVERDEAVVRVHNLGPPIPESERETIFDPLVQLSGVESAIERPRSSAGLGLFIARRIMEAHGGTLDVTSDATAGTMFEARLSTDR